MAKTKEQLEDARGLFFSARELALDDAIRAGREFDARDKFLKAMQTYITADEMMVRVSTRMRYEHGT